VTGFFKRVIKDADRKVFLILDNLEDQIEAAYLLSYSPESNPDERLNADFKAGITKRAPVRGKKQLKDAAIGHLGKLRKSPARVRKYFEQKPVRYAA
jgi:hypothetical protein